jgi:DNA polymerase-3 subunit chi
MSEILFYHLQRQPIERVLPALLERSIDRGWRCVVESPLAERIAELDDQLWTYSEESFLPHARAGEPDADAEVIVLANGPENPNDALVRFLLDGAELPQSLTAYRRIVVIFDGGDDVAIGKARADWKAARASGHDCTYWQEDVAGRWIKKA